MKISHRIERDIVLVGAGHAHVDVLKQFAMRPCPGVRLSLIARDTSTPYSGMLPGHLAGHYSHSECHIDLGPLCRFAGARLFHTSAEGIDLDKQLVRCSGRPPVPFDLLSIDVGTTPDITSIRGAREHAIAIKPVDRFLTRWSAMEPRIASGETFRVVTIGGGAGGVEATLALRHRLDGSIRARGGDPGAVIFTLVTESDEVLPEHARTVRQRMGCALRERGIEVHLGQRVVEVDQNVVRSARGLEIPHDLAIVVTHACPPRWLADTGLELDTGGFVRVNESLQAIGHDHVLAAGDVAAFATRALPKNGVYAVRQGPVLAENLRLLATGKHPRPYRPQARALALISTGDQSAVASYGRFAVQGPRVWRIKDWIDRRWMRRYQQLPPMKDDAEPMRCGGCGAKVPADVLKDVLDEVHPTQSPAIRIGLGAPDDAAVSELPPGMLCVQTVDQFRSFIEDPYEFAAIAANHCLSDIYAMGATPHSALAMVTLPYMHERKVREDMVSLLRGALSVLDAAGVSLVGGHTGEGSELAFGLAVTGYAAPDALLAKTGLRPGDVIVLTKPLGTGTILAADMQGRAESRWLSAALATMRQSNQAAGELFTRLGASACTDVTGFGLLGHLAEMIASPDAPHVELDTRSIPVLDGARELLAAGIHSTLHPANERNRRWVTNPERLSGGASILFDPQTAGGLIAGIHPDRADECLEALHRSGYARASIIGRVCTGVPGRVSIV